MLNNFSGGHWGQCLESLSHLCEYSDDILLVSGPSGIGKSTMKNVLATQESDKFMVCKISATCDITPESLTQCIDLECDKQTNKELLLLIDDAQNLSLDVVTLLLRLKKKTAVSGLLHIVLFATSELEEKISFSVLKDDFFEQVHIVTIEPLTLSEVEAFIVHEFGGASDIELLLNKSKLKKIYKLSQGIPGHVKQIAEKMLITGQSVSTTIPTKHKTSLSLLTVGVAVSFGVLFCILAVIWPSAELPEVITQVSNPIVVADVAPPPIIDPEPVITVADDEKIALLESKLDALQQQLAAEQEARRVIEAKLQQPRSPVVEVRHTAYERQILAIPSQHYAIQLLGSNSEKKAQDFIKNNKLTNKANYYRGIHNGKPWFIVVYGNYYNKSEAQRAVSKLPASLRKLHPWPRQYSHMQDSIVKNAKIRHE